MVDLTSPKTSSRNFGESVIFRSFPHRPNKESDLKIRDINKSIGVEITGGGMCRVFSRGNFKGDTFFFNKSLQKLVILVWFPSDLNHVVELSRMFSCQTHIIPYPPSVCFSGVVTPLKTKISPEI